MDITPFIITKDCTVRDAMQKLSETGMRMLLLCEDKRLCGIITDGDVRRFILSGGQITQSCALAANQNPKTVKVGEHQKAKRFFEELDANGVPVIGDDGTVQDIYFDKNHYPITETVDIPVVIMAGGLGTRLYPYTKVLPKPLIPVGELPIIEHIINKFTSFGCKDFYIVVNHRKEMIKAYMTETPKPYNLYFIDEDIPLGTAGGLSLLKEKINSSFFLTNCDTLIDADYGKLYKEHQDNGNTITVVSAFKHMVIPYGVITLADDGAISEFTEKPKLDVMINTGFYVVDKKIVDEIPKNYNTTMPAIIDDYRNKGDKVGVYPIREDSFMDMGQLEELEEMRLRLENGT